MARDLTIDIVVDTGRAKQELAAVDQMVDKVTTSVGSRLSAALDSVDRKWQTLTGTLSNARGILNGIAEGVGLTYAQLGLFNSAMAVLGSAVSGWNAGRMIAEFFDLDKKIGNATANLIGWSDATQVAGAKQDTMALASTRAHRVILDYNEAIRVNQEFVDQAVRKRAPEEFARQMESWRDEIQKIQAAGALPSLKAALDTHAISIKELSASYRVSEGAVALYRDQLADEAKAHREAEEATKRHAAEAKRFRDELERHTEAARKVEAAFFGLHEAVGQVDDRELKYVKTSVELHAQLDKIEETAHILNFGFKGMAEGLENVGTKVRDLGPDIQHQFVGPMQDATTQVLSFKQSLDAVLRGNFAQGFSSIFKGIRDSLDPSKIFSNLLSGGLSSLISSGVNLLMSGVQKLFGGPSKDELAARSTVADFQKQFGTFEQMSRAIGEAFVFTGHSAGEAQMAITRLLESTHQNADAAKTAIQGITDVLNEQAADQARAKALIDEYHISIDQLGPAFRAQQLNEQAKGLMNDFRLMVNVLGIDAPVAIDLMKDKINQYVQAAIATGTEVPANMKPMLEQMMSMGILTDASGTKIEDLQASGITFAETFSQGVDRIIAKFDELIARIYGASTAVNAMPTSRTVTITTLHDDLYTKRDAEFAAMGGYVTANGIQYLAGGGNVLRFMPRGSDVVPAMLTPGEGVLNRGAMGRIGGAAGLHRLNAGGGSGVNVSVGNITVEQGMTDQQAEEMIGRTVVQGMRRRGVRFSNR
jgi:hypothetical protein